MSYFPCVQNNHESMIVIHDVPSLFSSLLNDLGHWTSTYLIFINFTTLTHWYRPWASVWRELWPLCLQVHRLFQWFQTLNNLIEFVELRLFYGIRLIEIIGWNWMISYEITMAAAFTSQPIIPLLPDLVFISSDKVWYDVIIIIIIMITRCRWGWIMAVARFLWLRVVVANLENIIIIIAIIIIIITRPSPVFGRLGLGGSSRRYSSHG